MEKAEIIAVAVVAFIAAVEILCLFLCSRIKGKSYPLCVILPVLPDDRELPERLEYLASIIEDGSSLIGNILLVNFGGSPEQLELCRKFCSLCHCSELIDEKEIADSMKKYLHLTVALSPEI